MSELNFSIDKNKCIHCKQCVADCPSHIINFNAENFPSIKKENEQFCLKCQHCLAICPTGAISILEANPENSQEANNFPTDEQMLSLIKSRRSFRSYKQENLPPEVIQKLKDMLKYPPTGCNNHGLVFSIIDDIEIMKRFANRTNNKIKKIFLSGNSNNPIAKKFERYKKSIINGEDIIYRNAPHMIVANAPINAPCANEDGIIALSYFELYAQSLGVGTLWCGFAQICLKLFPDLCEFLEIPDGHKPVYVMLFGPTDLNYKRSIQPKEYRIISVKGENNVDNIPLGKKIKRYFWNHIR